MNAEEVGKLLSALISGGTVGSISLAIAEGLKLANALVEPDPAKRAKARREYYLSMLKLVKEVENASPEDVEKILFAFTRLMDE